MHPCMREPASQPASEMARATLGRTGPRCQQGLHDGLLRYYWYFRPPPLYQEKCCCCSETRNEPQHSQLVDNDWIMVSWMYGWLLLVLYFCPWSMIRAYRFADHITGSLPSQAETDGNDGPSDSTTSADRSRHPQSAAVTHLADIPPPTANLECYTDAWRRSDQWLLRYWDEHAGFEKQVGDDAEEDHPKTYGEVTPLGVRQLAWEMGISNENCTINTASSRSMVFYDLGSGVGRLVTQLYLDQPHAIVDKAVGVELAWDRHELAQQALVGIQNEVGCTDPPESDLCPPIRFIHGDATQVDWSDATHLFLSSLCFPDVVLESLQQTILQLPEVQVVAALNRLDWLLRNSIEWEERQVHIQMSWGPGIAKVYQRRTAVVGDNLYGSTSSK